jgi:hypothetical protein
MQQSSNDKPIKMIDGNGKNVLNFASGLVLLVALVSGGMMGCQKQDADQQEKQKVEAKLQANPNAYIKEHREAGGEAVAKKQWSRAKTASENALKIALDNGSEQESKRTAFWGTLPEKISGNLEYKVHPTQPVCEISGLHNKKVATLVLPESIEGKKVIRLGRGAFSRCRSLTSVTIPSSVTSIGERAFYACGRLTSVTIPKGVTSIGKGAFSECNVLTSVTISSSVMSIGKEAFWGCKSLTSVTIPSSVTSIGYGAFSGCEGLTSVTIPKGVKIGLAAFKGCPWQPGK